MDVGDTAVHISFLTREVWDFIIFAVIAIGGVWALWQLHHDLTAPPIDAEQQEVRGHVPPPSSAATPEQKEPQE